VLASIGESFLNDPIGGEVDSGGQARPLAPVHERHLNAGVAGAVDQIADPLEARLGRVRGLLIAEHVE
jgi:hypothetical protein